jgi:FAD/FMN-containing dehydrogenase
MRRIGMAAESQVAGGLKEDIVQTLAASLRGKLFRPSDPEYDDARHIWNGMIDRYPALIVRVHGTTDVVTAVNFAREHGLQLAIRGGGCQRRAICAPKPDVSNLKQ